MRIIDVRKNVLYKHIVEPTPRIQYIQYSDVEQLLITKNEKKLNRNLNNKVPVSQ